MKHIAFKTLSNPTLESLTAFDTLILPVFSDANSNPLADVFGLTPFVDSLIQAGDFSAKGNQTLVLTANATPLNKRLILIGLGENVSKLTEKSYIAAIKAVFKALETTGALAILNGLTQIDFQSASWRCYQNTLNTQQSTYEYTHVSRGKFTAKTFKLESMTFITANNDSETQKILAQGQASAIGMHLTQDLANMPSNFCTPSYLAKTAINLAETYGFEIHILEREEMIEMGMGSFMAVAQGSPTPPKMICLRYLGTDSNEAPIALVGKGVTFDTGGISLKPGASMDEMKYDMGGAATVLGTFKALGELKPKLNVVGVIPATENMPSGNAIKPGDVVTSLSGQTIEILNTDAEGRLILCDALTYTQQTYQPAKIIDMATLTGACIIALGHDISAILGNDQTLVDDLLNAGKTTYDRLWQLPLSEEYDELLKSNFADMANIGGRPAGTITAAQFLARFTKDIAWAHLDIAGTAWVSGTNKGATGRPVPTLVEYLLTQASQS
ncbi:MAG: leucyl aminopeptidase [Thiotrichales bacterium]|nr:leucyl aminopeptidase [Thiotrichales bacterium]